MKLSRLFFRKSTGGLSLVWEALSPLLIGIAIGFVAGIIVGVLIAIFAAYGLLALRGLL